MWSGIVVPARVSSGNRIGESLCGPDGERTIVNPDDARRVSFRTSGLVIELEITGSGESRQMAGRLIPAQPGVVEIRGVVAVEADARGRFTAEAVPPGQVSVRCRLGTDADRARIATGWVPL
jgi:hypothetical protein